MLFQAESSIMFIIWLILATVLLWLIIYLSVLVIQSKTKASDKKFMELLLAFIIALFLPIVLSAISMVLGSIGQLLALIRFDGGGNPGALLALVPIIGFLIVLVLTKYLIDLPWDNSVWISLFTLFILYILFTVIPELNSFIGFAL
ncbi:MAG: hypothetical protein ACTSPH_01090 [Promethearchaeota archaeon]